ncbi:MAG: GntR family transcriptional regulator [Clostridia bacterium]|nr:GntR family transcriptional regulator [Clostridia bacterium]MBO4429412.1 GntR family transcriptional regulator [Clostridia bacterium]
MFEKNLSIISLFDVYGAMLSEQKQKMFELYYGDDLSLSEIAEEMNISRQGVRESLKKCEEQLLEFEEKLGFLKKSASIKEAVEKLKEIRGDDGRIDEIIESLSALI